MNQNDNSTGNQCAFCDFEGKLTREHVISDWIGEVLEKPKGWMSHRTTYRHVHPAADANLPPEEENKRFYPGHPLDDAVKIVCDQCNNKWMSQVVNEAKPYVEPLILGQWLLLSEVPAQKVATWATLCTMTHEFRHKSTAAIPRSDRKFIKLNKRPPLNWRVWLGYAEDPAAVGIWHRGFSGQAQGSNSKLDCCNIQTTVFTIGKLVVQTASSALEEFDPTSANLEDEFPLVPIWPVVDDPHLLQPTRPIEPEEIEELIGGFGYCACGVWLP